ncbi:hypothetical protein HYPSUDRAFT_140969 [Hypholoma sublateritium FD-334 SS-4]|uniref:Arrestin-like N-terminal domain-containing protein n=1 Tax=Hypholoma sublateritium (strain FD-334 SS-4) TaxID=945553 RepID=A0A0D2NXP1_HYPSF|nr:hypothetical protein HYPSUDRAFT_140969 [Hypholoma sublateritium FD-334 SS-4]
MDFELPSYASLAPVPSYSCELATGERSLQQTPRSRASRSPPTSLFIKKAGKTTITLDDQVEDASTPTYGRRGVISGNILLERSETVLDVVLKIEGKLDATISNGGSESVKLFADTYTLWSHTTSQGLPCPSQLPFNILIPSTFQHNGQNIPLPPSYNASYYNLPSLFVRAGYQLHFIVSRLRHQKVGAVWPKTKHILLPFSYIPRTRPHRPIIYSDCFFSSIKSTPEEWHQAVSYLKRYSSNATTELTPPLSANLFVPAGRIYGLGEKIPFHVQISGAVHSLRELFSGTMLDRVMSADSHNTVETLPKKRSAPAEPLLRVTLLRQISVSLKNGHSWKNVSLAEGSVSPVPPDLMSWYAPPGEFCPESHIDWEGELSVDDEKLVSGFMAAHVQVKDFICLTITPPNTFKPTSLIPLKITIPIRLVTDSFAETAGLERTIEP